MSHVTRESVHAECESIGADEVASRLAAGVWVSPCDGWASDWLRLADRRSDSKVKKSTRIWQIAATTAAIAAAVAAMAAAAVSVMTLLLSRGVWP